jgi:hypothetical protein
MNSIPNTAQALCFELRFVDLFNAGRGLAFPCDVSGHVDIDDLSQRVRDNYFYARTFVGRRFSVPVVRSATQSSQRPASGSASSA